MNPVWTDRPRVPLWVDAEDAIVSQHLIQMGDWDAPLAQFLEAILEPEDTFLDLGAHVGYFSLVAANKCKKVIAVEPQAEMCELIRLNERENIEVKQVAVGAEAGEKNLHIPPNKGAASFHHEVGREESVAVCALKDVADGATACKIDIEGDDAEVLAANPDFLSSLRFLVFEYAPHQGGRQVFETVKPVMDIYEFGNDVPLSAPPELLEGFYVNLVGVGL